MGWNGFAFQKGHALSVFKVACLDEKGKKNNERQL